MLQVLVETRCQRTARLFHSRVFMLPPEVLEEVREDAALLERQDPDVILQIEVIG